ncbi:MAG: alpha/beta hydrolase [Deltaproteobacteria bacterium]|nr:MAG: alpha/beta hydrolase [Deltaproteobacteria bacterium]TMQ05803.1 MAG: alpha/beta hydrolase [Deltaproteobacteria bacterium]
MTTLFQTEAGKQSILGWYERFRAKLTVPTESRTVTTGFGDTHVLIGGPETGPPVLLLHGALASSAHLLVELAALLEQFRVYAVDIVGQSVKSAETRISVTNNDHGLWLREVLDQLGLAQTHVVGVSWGGFVAIRLAVCAPERIDRLALLVPAGVVGGPVWAGLTKMALPMLMYRLWPSQRRLQRFLRHLLTTHDDDWTPYLGDALRLYNLRMSVPALVQPAELARFTRPTLVVGAEHDVGIPGAKLITRAAALFPSLAGTELIEGAYHSPPTTPVFRQWLSGRLTRFFLNDEHKPVAIRSGTPDLQAAV